MTKTFGKRLQEAREKRGLSRRDLAELSGVSYPNICNLETDVNGNPTLLTLLGIVDSLEISLDELIGRKTRVGK